MKGAGKKGDGENSELRMEGAPLHSQRVQCALADGERGFIDGFAQRGMRVDRAGEVPALPACDAVTRPGGFSGHVRQGF